MSGGDFESKSVVRRAGLRRRLGPGCWVGMWTAVIGLFCLGPLNLPLGMDRWSYDLPFLLRQTPVTSDLIRIVGITARDESKHQGVLKRAVMAQLVTRLTSGGARLILLDFTYHGPQSTEDDRALSDAIRSSGRVVLGSEYMATVDPHQRSLVVATNYFRDSGCAAMGSLNLDATLDSGNRTLRRLTTCWRSSRYPSLAWEAARLLQADVCQATNNILREFWLNYCGPPPKAGFLSYDLDQILQNDIPDDQIQGRVFVVGGDSGSGVPGQMLMDAFSVPWTFWQGGYLAGAVIHATALRNLVEGSWMERVDRRFEAIGIVVWSFLLGWAFSSLRPVPILYAVCFVGMGVAGVAVGAHFLMRIWGCWLVPGLVQPLVAGTLAAWANRRRPGKSEIFICYRWSDGAVHARLLKELLATRGVWACMDVDFVRAGKLRPQLWMQIERVSGFMVVLTPNLLEELWKEEDDPRREMLLALKQRKRILVVVAGDGFWMLTKRDFTSPRRLLERLKRADDRVSAWLRDQFGPKILSDLRTWCPPQEVPDALLDSLVVELNQVLRQQNLYDSKRFEECELSRETSGLLREAGDEKTRLRLNRLLLGMPFQKAWRRRQDDPGVTTFPRCWRRWPISTC